MTKRKNNDGLLWPHNIEAEEAVLGGLLIDPEAWTRVVKILIPSDFYIERHGWVYEAILQLVDENKPVDFLTICDALEAKGQLEEAGGSAWISSLINAVPSAVNIEHYAELVQDTAHRRGVIRAAGEQVKDAHNREMPFDEVLRRAEDRLLAVRRSDCEGEDARELFARVGDMVTSWKEQPLQPGEVRGTPTGMHAVDRMLGGLRTGLYILAARTSMGKTSIALQWAGHIAENVGKVLFFTPEMTEEEVALRLACQRARVEQRRVERGTISDEEWFQVLGWLDKMRQWPLKIYDKTSPSAYDVRAAIMREQQRGEDVKLAVVDGLGLMLSSDNAENRNLELGAITRSLKLAANSLGTTIIAIHQLNRSVEKRADKRPNLSDLRESGQIEEHSDVVLMLYREGYYDKDPEARAAGEKLEIWCMKNRKNGPAGERALVWWEGPYMRAVDIDWRVADVPVDAPAEVNLV